MKANGISPFISAAGAKRAARRTSWAIHRVVATACSLTVAAILRNKITSYWYWRVPNFGDLITPLLLKAYGFTAVHSCPSRAQVVSCGSILEALPRDYSGYILGSGLMYDHPRDFKNATILALRGKLTHQRLRAGPDVALGDPGLLASRLLKHRERKRHVLGIVPHYVDKGDRRIVALYRRYKDDIAIIDVQRRPLRVISHIDACAHIISSSLHGLVVADSLRIPCAYTPLSDKVTGKGFKFADYHSALEIERYPLYLSGAESLPDIIKQTARAPCLVEKIANDLDRAFKTLRSELRT